MALTPGTRLGVYEITIQIGEGGMGEVYRARDTKLNRDVAIKVLPESFAKDPDRLARFEREAQVLAALNRPNIAHIHGLEESQGIGALVMELVEGDDLSVLIARGPIPLTDALPIARQIADALEAAHEQGIIHRDLKPANIKVRTDGTVKVLDFGLAKAMDPAASSSAEAMNSPTFSVRATQMGVIIGSAAYMAPEQARDADRRHRRHRRRDRRRPDVEPQATAGQRRSRLPRVLTGRKWVAFQSRDNQLQKISIGGGTPLTLCKTGVLWGASWDGDTIVFASRDSGILRLSANGGEPEVIVKTSGAESAYGPQLLDAGRLLLFTLATEQGGERWDVDTLAVEKHSSFSPDGRWLAYMATSEGNAVNDVFVQPFPPTGAKYQVSIGSGRAPVWSPDGKQLFFHNNILNRLFVVDVHAGQGLTCGTPMPLPLERTIHPQSQRNYDVTPDGTQLIVVLPAQATPSDPTRRAAVQINVVLNWFEELRSRAHENRRRHAALPEDRAVALQRSIASYAICSAPGRCIRRSAPGCGPCPSDSWRRAARPAPPFRHPSSP